MSNRQAKVIIIRNLLNVKETTYLKEIDHELDTSPFFGCQLQVMDLSALGPVAFFEPKIIDELINNLQANQKGDVICC